MMLVISPGKPLHGEITLPGDKSLSHRAALFAALAEGESQIDNFLISGVTEAMLNAIRELGVKWQLHGSRLVVEGRGFYRLHEPVGPIDCGNSATTLRLLTGALAAAGVPVIIDGSEGLRRRPMGRIVDPLKAMGVIIQATNGCAPLELTQSIFPLHPLHYRLPVASAQVKSCLLLAALAASGPSDLEEPGPSRDHTERMLRCMGVDVQQGEDDYQIRLIPPQPLRLNPMQIMLPGDFSAAAFLIVAGLIVPGTEIWLRGVGLNPTRTGLLDALLSMGADITITHQTEQGGEPIGDLRICYSVLQGIEVAGEQVVRMIDEFPVFAVAAAFAHGPTMVSEAEELRYKESDRIGALCQELSRIGVDAQEAPDGFIIQGGYPVHGGSAVSHGDHRLAMALAVAGLATIQPVQINGAEIIAESFPDFVECLRNLGAQIDLESE